MKTSHIHTIQDMQRYVEGCINDFETGVSTKDETIDALRDYTIRVIELTVKKNEVLQGRNKFLKTICNRSG